MSIAWQVAGPCELWVSTTTSTPVLLGRTSNDDLVRFNRTRHHRIETDIATGAAPAQAIIANEQGLLTCTLVKWDSAVYDAILTRVNMQDPSASGAKVGYPVITEVYGDGGWLVVQVKPLIAGRKGIELECVLADGDSFVDSEFGNAARRLAVSLMAVPHPTTNIVYKPLTA